jgi:hypothetical protein
MIGGALVGTFLGVFLAYGSSAPLRPGEGGGRGGPAFLPVLIREVLIANLHRHPANICIEVGRQNTPHHVRPSFWKSICRLAAARRSGRPCARVSHAQPETGGGWRYDISTVFDLIPRDKLSAVWVDPQSGVLRLGLGCECHAIATPFRPGIVVIDILDGVAPAGSPYETALADAGNEMPVLVRQKALRPKPRPVGLVPDPVPEPLPAQVVQRLAPAAPVLPPLSIPTPDPRAAEMRERLLRDLSRSIAAGAVKPVAQLPVQDPRPALSRPVVLPLPSDPGDSVQVRVRPATGAPDSALTTSGQACIADTRLDLAAWASDADPVDQFVTAQSAVLGEFDRPDRDRLIGLVRLNLHFGFGAEARSLIRLWGRDDPEAAVLDALGTLVDGGISAPVFEGMLGCDSAAALWAVLARTRLPPGADINRAAVLAAFSALPLGLRRHLGPAVSERFLAAGDTENARSIRDAIDRAAGPHGDNLTMIDASLDLADGEHDLAERKLEAVVADDGAAAARALATLVESRLSRGERPEAAQVVALESMLNERRSSPEAEMLRRALAKGQATIGSADRAFRDVAATEAAIYPELWSLLTRHADEIEFAALALDPPGTAVADLPADVRLAVARRLHAGGFAEGARRWTEGLASDDAGLLLAQVALDLQDGRDALRRLGGQDGEEAGRLRAQALTLLGDAPAALAAWEAAGDASQAARMRLLARQWDDLNAGDDAPLRAVLATRMPAPPVAPDSEGAPLAQARTLLETSGAARDAISALLASRQVPEG